MKKFFKVLSFLIKIKIIPCFLYSVFFILDLYGQSQFVKTFGGPDNDWSYSIRQTRDKGFAVTGKTWSFGQGNSDLFLTQFDASGNIRWTKTLGENNSDYSSSVTLTQDAGVVVTGTTWSFGAGYYDLLLTKFDSLGNTIWTKTLGGRDVDYGASVIETRDGSLVVTGWTWYVDGDTDYVYDLLLAKFALQGNALWTTRLGGINHDAGYSIIETQDSGYVITGYTYSFGAGSSDLLLAKFDAQGTKRFAVTLGGKNHDYGNAVIETPEGGLAVIGETWSFGAGNYDILVAKFDSQGNSLWTKTLGGEDSDFASSIIHTQDGGLVVTGYTYSFGASNADLILAKFDSLGKCVWTTTLGSTYYDAGYSVTQTQDSGYMVTGVTNNFGSGSLNLLLAKFDEQGNSCIGSRVSPTIQDTNLSITIPAFATGTPSLTVNSYTPTVTSSFLTEETVCNTVSLEENISFPENFPRIVNLPSIFQDKILLQFLESSKFPLKIALYNVSGARIFLEKYTNTPSFLILEGGKLLNLPQGVYFLSLSSGDFSKTFKIIKMDK